MKFSFQVSITASRPLVRLCYKSNLLLSSSSPERRIICLFLISPSGCKHSTENRSHWKQTDLFVVTCYLHLRQFCSWASLVHSHAPSIRSHSRKLVVFPDFQPMRVSEKPVCVHSLSEKSSFYLPCIWDLPFMSYRLREKNILSFSNITLRLQTQHRK